VALGLIVPKAILPPEGLVERIWILRLRCRIPHAAAGNWKDEVGNVKCALGSVIANADKQPSHAAEKSHAHKAGD
jgi:hypothetical protein